ncbi:TORTIFOLIA1-like protein 4 [Cucurbita pepo subsp. pepo]|uniref:TORTIFOLIA1-like protein 4 n=1 Tax=Cucurbita pepo subsp. pepo TaxID=3664 RepID=UPI000C9D7C9B|nr:TORTIFOLIA1-like protein 4 [Cucurbita pepo subsp. pepo]XP_023546032.1 TORTIFOLIA1-like protein 4 [Cucurbita pepo subsp. pepo]XP_023546033.1 TORTIFOLIA1-like protein 4 [Cucurbita pepo subsp. pepo]
MAMSSLSKRSSLSPPQPAGAANHDLKQRVIACLNKLEDRDTLAMAANELESIARALTCESFSLFLSCIHNTDASSKSPVRKQCVYLLGLLSQSHGDALSPFVSKMISTVVRRLRDSDSTIRSACIDATALMSSQITKPPFSVFLKPLMETLTLEQDLNSQIGSALCLAAAVEAAPDPDVSQLRKNLPRLGKLAKNEGFKAKAALLVLIGSIIAVGGAMNRSVMDWLVPCIVEFLSNDDWAVRKAAAETLGRMAVAERELAAEYRTLCISSLDSRRFDKIKVVRETMNQTLELWKDIPDASGDVSTDNGNGGCFSPTSTCHPEHSLRTPLKKTVPTSRSSPLEVSRVTNNKKMSPKDTDKNSSTPTSKLERQKSSNWSVEITVSNSPSSKLGSKNNAAAGGGSGNIDFEENGTSRNSLFNAKRVLYNNVHDEKVNKSSNLRSGSRVVPFEEYENIQEHENRGSDVTVGSSSEETFGSHKDFDNISLVRDQLRQIENQQSSLLNLLQSFIGSSQSGMNSLEQRVHGLEMALDEISHDLGLSSGRVLNSGFAENSCCKLPGAEFLSSKFWRRAEGRYPSSKFCSMAHATSPNDLHHTFDRGFVQESIKQNSQRFRTHTKGGLVMNPLADVENDLRENLGQYPKRLLKTVIQEDDSVPIYK